MPAFERHAPEMDRLWNTMKIIRDATQLDAMARKVLQHKAIYQKVEKDTGVPWQMVAVIHIREAGLQDVGVFNGGIHNGQSWRRKATIIPKIGPFSSWHECAVVSLKRLELDKIKKWTPGMMLAGLEPYNGYGYRNRGLRSPYVWASTNHQQPGKYVRDGVFDASVIDTQMGCAAMLRFLGVGKASAKDIITKDGTIVTTTTTLALIFQKWAPVIIIGGALGLAGLWLYRYLKNRDVVKEPTPPVTPTNPDGGPGGQVG